MSVDFVADGVSTFSIDVSILNDDDFEGFHSFTIAFDSASPIVSGVGDIGTTTITIGDFEGKDY